jgi:uncharacterized oxidoreductase
MKLEKNTVLVTGGSTGIGFALAKRFADAGSDVVICGRRREALDEARRQCPALQTIVSDVATDTERTQLFKQVTERFPRINILINNAGIQNHLPPLVEKQDWNRHSQEISINLEAPMHLSMLFISHLLKQDSPAIMNVSSGLAFAPIAFMPTYCATKAALHSFTLSLRYQLKDTPIRVVEIIPPAVNTDLGGKGLHTFGVNLDEFADHVMNHLKNGDLEFGYGTSEEGRLAPREKLDKILPIISEKWKSH